MNLFNLIAIVFLGFIVYLAIERICECIEKFIDNRLSKFNKLDESDKSEESDDEQRRQK